MIRTHTWIAKDKDGKVGEFPSREEARGALGFGLATYADNEARVFLKTREYKHSL